METIALFSNDGLGFSLTSFVVDLLFNSATTQTRKTSTLTTSKLGYRCTCDEESVTTAKSKTAGGNGENAGTPWRFSFVFFCLPRDSPSEVPAKDVDDDDDDDDDDDEVRRKEMKTRRP